MARAARGRLGCQRGEASKQMPYNSWVQFRKQRDSVGLPVTLPVLLNEYPIRPLVHSRWNNWLTYDPADVLPLILPAWVQNNGGVVTIQPPGLATELLAGIRNYGALLESSIPQFIKLSAGGAVIYDNATDRLYYAASRFLHGLQIHATLDARIQQLPAIQVPGRGLMNTRVPNRHPHTCAEFKALNQALLDGAQEDQLDLWCFRAATMEPFPRCDNCQDTVPDNALRRIWTC
jgi:hypothetical protein